MTIKDMMSSEAQAWLSSVMKMYPTANSGTTVHSYSLASRFDEKEEKKRRLSHKIAPKNFVDLPIIPKLKRSKDHVFFLYFIAKTSSTKTTFWQTRLLEK